MVGGSEEKVVAMLEEALAGLPDADSELRARLMSRLSAELYFSTDLDRQIQLSTDSVAMARRVGDHAAIAHGLWTRWFTVLFREPGADWLTISEEMVEQATKAGDHQLEMTARSLHIASLLNYGQRGRADEEIKEHEKRAGELRQPLFEWSAGLHRTMIAQLDGRYQEATSLAQEASRIGQRMQDLNAAQMFGIQTFAVNRELGLLNKAFIDTTRNFAAQYPAVPAWRRISSSGVPSASTLPWSMMMSLSHSIVASSM